MYCYVHMATRLAVLMGFLVMALPARTVAESEPETSGPVSITTDDPTIPNDELKLMVGPLTQAELLVEAAAWQELVKAKAWDIAMALISVKRQNQEIEMAKQAQANAKAAREDLESAKEQIDTARRDGDESAAVQPVLPPRPHKKKFKRSRKALSRRARRPTERPRFKRNCPRKWTSNWARPPPPRARPMLRSKR